MTITIQIGNTDDKLTQAEWSAFVLMVRTAILDNVEEVHFFGGPTNYERWQNVCWVVLCTEGKMANLKSALIAARKCFNQDSIAWTEGETQFV